MSTVPTLPGVTSALVATSRLKQHVLVSGPAKGERVVFVHGNFSAATWFEETMLGLKDYHCIAPDLRGYGDSEDKLVDATRGVRDFTEDLKALSDALGPRPAHLVGWSLGAGVVMQFALDYPELCESLTLISPVSPFGFGGTKGADGVPCHEDFAGSGGGTVNPDFVQRIKDNDRSADSPNSPRNVINTFLYKPPFKARREEEYLTASMLERIGQDKYPGDFVASPHWPNVAPGRWGGINSITPKYFNVSALATMPKKLPILWVRGDADQIVSDMSFFDFGTLGKLGAVPGWPGDEVFPPQPMVAQMRAVLERYKANGGSYHEAIFADCGHSPLIEKHDEFVMALGEFLD